MSLIELPPPPGRVDPYPPLDEREYPDRFTNDHVRDALPPQLWDLVNAVTVNNIAKVSELIRAGADKNAPLDKDCMTCLMIASYLGKLDMVQHLVEVEGVDMDGPLSRAGLRAVDIAAKEGHRWPNEIQIVDYLKTKGSTHTWWGACFAGDIRRIQEYLENGQDIDAINPVIHNNNAIECAMVGGQGKTARFLMARGATIVVRNAHIVIFEEMRWNIGRGDAFMYKEWKLEDGEIRDDVKYAHQF